jgi:two-component system, sensor histidine kinase and response regulator
MMGNALQIEGIDIKSAMGRVAGNEKLLHKLLGRFVETQSDTAIRIKTAIDKNDLESATRDAHTIKGLAGNLGADLLFHYAQNLETLLKKGRPDQLDTTLETFATELSSLMKRISLVLEQPKMSTST